MDEDNHQVNPSSYSDNEWIKFARIYGSLINHHHDFNFAFFPQDVVKRGLELIAALEDYIKNIPEEVRKMLGFRVKGLEEYVSYRISSVEHLVTPFSQLF